MNTSELTAGNGSPSASRQSRAPDRDKLLSDLKIVVADVDAYLRASAGLAGEAYEAARARLETSLTALKTDLVEKKRTVVGMTESAARAADDYVRTNPWQSIAVVAGAGLVAGLLIGRR